MNYITFNGEEAKKTEFDGYYVTKSGKCITVKVRGGQGKLDFQNPRVHNVKIDKDGYGEVCISCVVNGEHKRIYRRLHRLVWETFNGKIINNLTVDHIDNDVTNNQLSNLQLLTREENGVKRHKNWVKDKRSKYKLYKNGEFIDVFDTVELRLLYNINSNDIYKHKCSSPKMKNMGITLEKV